MENMHGDVGNKGLRHVKSAITPRKKKLKCDSWHNTYLEGFVSFGGKMKRKTPYNYKSA